MNIGLVVLSAVLFILLGMALARRQDGGPIVKRLIEQFFVLVPKMLCALLAAGFLAQLIPKQTISGYLGADAGFWALPVAALTGLIIPAGPVIAFAIAAVFAKAGASTAALVTFITAWSIFALHRVLIYELPLLGPSFLRLRIVSVVSVPILAGLLAMLAGSLTGFGTAAPMP